MLAWNNVPWCMLPFFASTKIPGWENQWTPRRQVLDGARAQQGSVRSADGPLDEAVDVVEDHALKRPTICHESSMIEERNRI